MPDDTIISSAKEVNKVILNGLKKIQFSEKKAVCETEYPFVNHLIIRWNVSFKEARKIKLVQAI